MKKILIIGAGFLQTYVIKKAKELGYYVIGIDANPKAEGFAFCDEYAVIDIVDKEACLKYAKKMQVDGVLTAATDYGVLSAAYTANALSLQGIPYKTAEIIKNKYAVRKLINESGADDTGTCYEVSTNTNIKTIENEINYPVMVKPCDGAGSRGASKVCDSKDLQAACDEACRNSVSGRAVIEPFVYGKEYGVESFVYKGIVNVLGVMEKRMTMPPYYAELGHSMPNDLSSEIENNVVSCVKKAIETLGITFGSVNMDILISDSGSVHIVDIGARMGGNLIGSHIIPAGTGIMYMENMIKACVDDEACFETKEEPMAVATRLLALTPGKIKAMPDFNKIEQEYDVVIEAHLGIGTVINEYHTNLDGCGYIVATDKNIDFANERANKVLDLINKSIIRE